MPSPSKRINDYESPTDPEWDVRYDRMHENCVIIWGAETDFAYDVFTETDDWLLFHCFVRKIYITWETGDILMGSALSDGEDRAWDDLDNKLSLMAQCKLEKQAEAVAKKLEGLRI